MGLREVRSLFRFEPNMAARPSGEKRKSWAGWRAHEQLLNLADPGSTDCPQNEVEEEDTFCDQASDSPPVLRRDAVRKPGKLRRAGICSHLATCE